jgi:hypothetical protein
MAIPGPTREGDLVKLAEGSSGLLQKVIKPGKLGKCYSEFTKSGTWYADLIKSPVTLHFSVESKTCFGSEARQLIKL